MSWVDRAEVERKRKGWTEVELARRADVNPDRLYKWMQKDVQQPRGDSMQRLARALGVTANWLMFGSGPRLSIVPVIGFVGAGEEFYPVDDHARGAGLDELSLDFDVPDPIALRVRGNSMTPVYRDGDDLLCSRIRGEQIRTVIGKDGKDCAVVTLGGRGYVKLLLLSRYAGFVLRSYNPNFHDIENAEIDWVAPVVFIRRA